MASWILCSRHVILYVLVVIVSVETVLSSSGKQSDSTQDALKVSDSGDKRATWLVSRATRTGSVQTEQTIKPIASRASWLEMKRNGDVTSSDNHNNYNQLPNHLQHPMKGYMNLKQHRMKNKIPNRIPVTYNQAAVRNNRASWLQMKRNNALNNKRNIINSNSESPEKSNNKLTELVIDDSENTHAQKLSNRKSNITSRHKRDTFVVSGYDKNGLSRHQHTDENMESDNQKSTSGDLDIEVDNINKEGGEKISETSDSDTKTPLGHFINGRSSYESGLTKKSIKTRSLLEPNQKLSSNDLSEKKLDFKIKHFPNIAKKATWLKATKRMPTRSYNGFRQSSSSLFGLPNKYDVPFGPDGGHLQQKRMPTRDMNSFFPYEDYNHNQQQSMFERMFLPNEDYGLHQRMPTRAEHSNSFHSNDDDFLETRMPTRDVKHNDDDTFIRMPTRNINSKLTNRMHSTEQDTAHPWPSVDKRMPTRGLVSRMPTRTARAMWLPVRDLY